MSEIKISIITATYNSSSTITRCISSVNDQSFQNIEHIIIDGASTDKTIEIIKYLPNRIVQIISEPDNGIYDALNKGIQRVTGEIIGFLHSNDCFYSRKTLKNIVSSFSNENQKEYPDVVYGDWVFTDKKDSNKIILQSNIVKNGLIKSYSIEPDQIIVQPHPISLRNYQLPEKSNPNDKLKLFYPASNYKHKNYKLIIELDDNYHLENLVSEIIITVPEPPNLRKGSIIKALGTISHQECFEYYSTTNCLLFPSFMESYGLPLIEAMYVGIPIIAPRLEYAEWICGSEAIYFDPNNVESLFEAINILKQRVSSGWIPDYSKQLEKFPVNWDIVSETYIKALV